MKQIFVIFLFFSISFSFLNAQTGEKYYQDADTLASKEQYKAAITLLDKAIKIDSAVYKYYKLKGYCQSMLKMSDAALNTFTRGIETNPNNSEAWSTRGFHVGRIGWFPESFKDFDVALEKAETDSIYYHIVGLRTRIKGLHRDYQGVYEDLQLVLKFNPNDLPSLNDIALNCRHLGKTEEGLGYLFKALAIDSTTDYIYANIGFLYQTMGEYEKSNEYYNKVIKLFPDYFLGYSNRSYNKLQLGDLKGAKKDIEKAIQLYPENSYAYRNRALIHIKEKKLKKACADLDLAIKYNFSFLYGTEVEELQKKYCK